MSEGLARYQIMDPLGAGRQGQTFRAVDRDTGREVAVKTVSIQGADDWKGFDLFEREVEVLERLDHPAIPGYLDRFESPESGDYFLVMELVEGRTLAALRDAGEVTAERVIDWFDQVLVILEYLHARVPPVVHRDIKPSNLILRPDGQVVLVDFGAVKSLEAGAKGGSTLIGTYGYMAPEQLHGDANPATDVYALGATAVALLTGRDPDDLPHDGLRMDLESVLPASNFRDLLAQMLEPDPKHRLSNAAAVRSALAGTPPPRRKRQAKRAKASHPDGEPAASVALEVSRPVRALAKAPAPFSIIIWLIAMVGSVAFVVGEIAVLPLLRMLMKMFGGADGRELVSELHHDTRVARTNFRFLADATYPFGEEPARRLPAGRVKNRRDA